MSWRRPHFIDSASLASLLHASVAHVMVGRRNSSRRLLYSYLQAQSPHCPKSLLIYPCKPKSKSPLESPQGFHCLRHAILCYQSLITASRHIVHMPASALQENFAMRCSNLVSAPSLPTLRPHPVLGRLARSSSISSEERLTPDGPDAAGRGSGEPLWSPAPGTF